LAGPSEVIERLSERLELKDDCSNFDAMPLLGFAIKDKVLNLKPDDYIDRDATSCSLSLMALDVPPPKGPLFVFGDPFLRRFLTVYDRDGPSVGFAVAQHQGLTREEAAQFIAAVRPGSAAPAKAATESKDDEGIAGAWESPGSAVASSSSPADDGAGFDGPDIDKAMSSEEGGAADLRWEAPLPSTGQQGSLASTGEHVVHGGEPDPFGAVTTESNSWSDILTKLRSSRGPGSATGHVGRGLVEAEKHWLTSAQSGMIQTEDHLVSISLSRTPRRIAANSVGQAAR
jgi:hypothetical protein